LKKQPTVALACVESEYMAASHATREAVWLKSFLSELQIIINHLISIACDSQGAMAIMKSPEYHARTKHIDIRHHYVREKVNDKTVVFNFVDTNDMMADILTKPITKIQHEKLVELIGLTV